MRGDRRTVGGVPNFGVVTRDHVISTLDEYDERGADDFLSGYGFGDGREQVLRHEGRSYDSKAILGVAHRYATGTVASDSAFTDGTEDAEKILSALGFDVASVQPAEVVDRPATGEWRESAEVGVSETRAAWAAAAREVLLDAASRYQGIVTYKDLSQEVQYRAGIRTKQPMRHWIGGVLDLVTADSAKREEPLLSSLCVNIEGSVGEGYAAAVAAATGESPSDPDVHAAGERLACYRHFEATDIPRGGGAPTLMPKLAAARERARKAAIAERPITKCPKCNLQVPTSGACDYCD